MPSLLIVAFDGLQPAQVTQELMPNLASFAEDGVTFGNHHAVFPTVTRVNAASMMTGRYPGGHGLAGNTVVFRDYDPHLAFKALEPTLAQVAATLGGVLLAPTLADVLAQHREEYVAVVSGTSGNAYVHNPNAEGSGGATIHPEFCLPRYLHDQIVSRFGPWAEEAEPNTGRMSRTVDILTGYVLKERRPAVSLLWLAEPDHTQHAYAAGSSSSNAALLEADRQFGRVLAWLTDAGAEADTDVIVISDHGHSTVVEGVDVRGRAEEAGFSKPAGKRDVIVAENGGSVLFYVEGSDPATADRLAAWLMAQPWCGPILSSEAVGSIPGTLPAALAGAEGARAPDLMMSFGWSSEVSSNGVPGIARSTGAVAGRGMHGSMSRQEIHNVLLGRGPSFKRNVLLDTPSGNVDLAPTVLAILGLPEAETTDGRPLFEALNGRPSAVALEWTTELHEAEREVATGTYRQRITVSRVGETAYIERPRAAPSFSLRRSRTRALAFQGP